MRFTKAAVASLSLPPGKSELIVFDDALKGFGVRLRGGGKRTWVVQYRVGAKQRRLSLGSLQILDLEEARAQAKRALAKVGLAIDPQLEKASAKTAASLSLRPLIDQYLAVKKERLRPRSYIETERQLMRDWATLHGQPVSSIGRRDVAARLGQLSIKNGPVAADRARAALSAFFSWSMREGLVEANPVSVTNRPATIKSRDRVLSDAELREIWEACREDDYGRIVRLLILTGQRREEVGGMRWSELDEGAGVWSLGPQRTKNGRPHGVPLSDQALIVIRSIPRREGRDLCFGEGAGPFSGWSKAKERLDDRMTGRGGSEANVGKSSLPGAWRLHDIRRTVATRMADLGVSPHVIEAVLNHVSGARAGVAGIYNRSLYSAEKRNALVLWGAHVAAIIKGEKPKVIGLRA
jgi:integrase